MNAKISNDEAIAAAEELVASANDGVAKAETKVAKVKCYLKDYGATLSPDDIAEINDLLGCVEANLADAKMILELAEYIRQKMIRLASTKTSSSEVAFLLGLIETP